jgi:hypothetical protein
MVSRGTSRILRSNLFVKAAGFKSAEVRLILEHSSVAPLGEFDSVGEHEYPV